MKNNLYNRYGSAQQRPNQNFQNGGFDQRFNSMDDFVDRYKRFAENFKGNPDEQLQALINNGTISQSVYDKLYGLAKKIMGA